MKKILISLSVIILGVAAFIFWPSENSVIEEASKDQVQVVEFEDNPAVKVNDQKKEQDSQTEEESKASQREVDDEEEIRLEITSDEELERRLEEKEEEFDRLEDEWLENVKNLFINEMQLTQAQFQDYMNMREGLFNDKIAAFEDMHKELEKKYGENYTYNPTEEEMRFDREIQQKYDDLLLKKIGKENFIKYLELRDRTNEKILEGTKQNDAAMLMEF